jgi:hypothetical protein
MILVMKKRNRRKLKMKYRLKGESFQNRVSGLICLLRNRSNTKNLSSSKKPINKKMKNKMILMIYFYPTQVSQRTFLKSNNNKKYNKKSRY